MVDTGQAPVETVSRPIRPAFFSLTSALQIARFSRNTQSHSRRRGEFDKSTTLVVIISADIDNVGGTPYLHVFGKHVKTEPQGRCSEQTVIRMMDLGTDGRRSRGY